MFRRLRHWWQGNTRAKFYVAKGGLFFAKNPPMGDFDLYQAKICFRILDNLNSAVLLFDERKRLIYINPGGEMLFGVSARKVVGTAAGELLDCPSHVVEDILNRALQTGQPFTERAMRLPLAGDRAITVDCTVSPLDEPAAKREILVEIEQVGRQLRISREERRLAQHQVTRALVRGLAHEIKNPLGGLRGAAQLLARELPDPALQEYTHIIIEEADRLQNLVNRMLGPNRLPQKRLVNLHQMMERVHSLIEAELAPSKADDGIRLVRDYDPSIPLLIADADQLIQALLNIVRNALQALDGKGEIILRTRVQRQYTIGHKRHKLVVCIDVIDNGPGISDELREALFFPMVTSRPDGTGLGLSIAQSLVNQHGGLIECTSRPGETTFSVLIPLEKVDDGE